MSATAPAMGGTGTLCVFSRVAWIGPMSTTFSLVVYVKPPQASPNRPSAMRIIPSVLFMAPPLAALPNSDGHADNRQFPQRKNMHGVEADSFTARTPFQSGRLSFELCLRVFRFGLRPLAWDCS